MVRILLGALLLGTNIDQYDAKCQAAETCSKNVFFYQYLPTYIFTRKSIGLIHIFCIWVNQWKYVIIIRQFLIFRTELFTFIFFFFDKEWSTSVDRFVQQEHFQYIVYLLCSRSNSIADLFPHFFHPSFHHIKTDILGPSLWHLKHGNASLCLFDLIIVNYK